MKSQKNKLLVWTNEAWKDYLYWQNQDKKTLKRINKLIKDTQRNPFQGIGKPEPLKENLSGFWSRRIDDSNRLVYVIDKKNWRYYLVGTIIIKATCDRNKGFSPAKRNQDFSPGNHYLRQG